MKYPVWQFEDDHATESSDRRVQPVIEMPVKGLTGCLVGTRIRLSNGELKWAVLGNITARNINKTKQFMSIWMENAGTWFEMARYFDVDFKRRGPEQLAIFLGLPVDQVFPMYYDITSVALGDLSVLKGYIEADPKDKLSEDELIALTLTDD